MVMTTATQRLHALTATTVTTRMPARLTATTGLIGSPEASLSEPDRGSAAASADVASVLAFAVVASVAEAALDEDSMAAGSAVVSRRVAGSAATWVADFTVGAMASTVAVAVSMAAEGFTAEADFTVEAGTAN